MNGHTPVETVERLVQALQRGDAAAAWDLYEPGGALVVVPGTVARGGAALQEALDGLAALRPSLTTMSYEVFEAGDLALYCSRWRLSGTAPDGSAVHEEGQSADVLRRAPDGTWRIVIDNPWGTAVLGRGAVGAESPA